MAVKVDTDSGKTFFAIGPQITTFYDMLYSGHLIL